MGLVHCDCICTVFYIDMKILHIEPTDVCQAACPQCARIFDTTFNADIHHHLTVQQIKDLNIDCAKLDKIFMCGVYGDPAAGKHTIDLYKYFRSINPDIILGMNTNGGLRTDAFWSAMAELTRKHEQDYVVFSIDGLFDTNHIYRRNVQWDKVMQNVQTYIDAGGQAHWDMLVFKHNQHQVDACEQLAYDMGFKLFRAKVSKRHEVLPVPGLEQPDGWQDPVVKYGDIRCQALQEQSRYISAQGQLYPCCYLGSTIYNIDQFDYVQQSWQNTPVTACVQTCSANETGTSFENQWQKETVF